MKLIDRGVNVHRLNQGLNMLLTALEEGRASTVRTPVQAGADKDALVPSHLIIALSQSTQLRRGFLRRSHSVVFWREIAREIHNDVGDSEKFSVFETATRYLRFDVVKILLNAGAGRQAHGRTISTALQTA